MDREELNHIKYMKMAISLAREGMNSDAGGPFGSVIVKDGKVIGKGYNKVTSQNDPTAHAEVTAIRDACSKLNDFQLEDCILYTSCEPCPMCLGAIYWARPKAVYYASSKEDAANIDFDDQFIYDEIDLGYKERSITFTQMMKDTGVEVFREWSEKEDRVKY